MAKKNVEVQEEVIEEDSGSALVAPGDALDYLLDGYQETEVSPARRVALPSLHLFLSGKKYSDKGAVNGWVIDKGDGVPEVNIAALRIARVDSPVMQRIMWPFGADGKRVQQEDPMPACASSDGVSARKADVFGYIGKEFTDWRNGNVVTIAPDNCKDCPLGQWTEVYNADGQPIMERNAKGVMYTKRSAPPCQETPAFVLYDFDRKMLLLYVVPNFTSYVNFMGSEGRYNKRFKGVIKGFEEFYYTAQGTKRPDVSPQSGVMYPLRLASHFVDNSPHGMFPAPKLELSDKSLTPEEVAEYATAVQLYRSDNLRDFVSGSMWSIQENMTPAIEPTTAETPW